MSAQQVHQTGEIDEALRLQKGGMEDWKKLLVANPRFREQPGVQEDAFEIQSTYLKWLQEQNEREMRGTLTAVTLLGRWIVARRQPGGRRTQ